MPSVATWWCGQEEPRRDVLEHLEKLVIKPTFPRFGQHAEFPATMSAETRRALAARIEAHPDAVRRAGTGGSLHRAGPHTPRARAAPRRAARARGLGRHVVRRPARAG